MLELITDLTWVIIIIVVGFVIVYSLVRLAAIAWHRTKQEYEMPPYVKRDYRKRKRQNDEEL